MPIQRYNNWPKAQGSRRKVFSHPLKVRGGWEGLCSLGRATARVAPAKFITTPPDLSYLKRGTYAMNGVITCPIALQVKK
jgi:hypothetical protein